jgi:hypothetical protein
MHLYVSGISMSNRRSIKFIQVLLLNDIPFGLVRLEALSIGHADDLSTTVKKSSSFAAKYSGTQRRRRIPC